MTKWAIMVLFDNEFMYTTEFVEGMDYNTPVVKTFDTREEAEQAADFWRLPGKEDNIKVVEYDSNTE